MNVRKNLGPVKLHAVRAGGATVAALRRRQARRTDLRPGVTVVTVTWNSLPYLRRMLAAAEAMSPPGTELLVVDNASTDGTREYLRSRGVRTLLLPLNVGHGVALDLAVPSVDTEYLAVLDVDAFPVAPDWLQQSIAALKNGAQVAGAHLHRNFVHPSFLVTQTRVLHELGLTFRPVGSLARLDRAAPLFLDVGEALSQRMIVKFGGRCALAFFEPTSTRGPGLAGTVFGGIVYHNLYATQGTGKGTALQMFEDAFAEYHSDLGVRE